MSDGPDDEVYGPEFEVWNHLWSGIDLATRELDQLEPAERERVERVARDIVGVRRSLVHQPESREAFILEAEEYVLDDPWFRHAIEIEIATAGIQRSELALKRYLRLRPAVARRPLPARASKYVAEVIWTFAFGFDAACIALCRGTLEQVLCDELVRLGVYTDPQIRRERPTAGALTANAKRVGILGEAAADAEQLVKKADTVMHRFIFEERVIEQQALDSVNQLISVLSEVLGRDAA